MAVSRGTLEHGTAIFSPAPNTWIQDYVEVTYTGRHIVPIVTVTGYQSQTSGLDSIDRRSANIYFTIENVTTSGFTIRASAPFVGKVFYIISSEGI